jgi:fumarate hydratase class II
MNDVERWLVDKEKEKQERTSVKDSSSQEDGHQELHDVRDEIAELQGRVRELGREMAKLATSTSNLSSGPKSQMASVIHAAGPSTSSVLVQQHTGSSI